jgi:hypothetical protein
MEVDKSILRFMCKLSLLISIFVILLFTGCNVENPQVEELDSIPIEVQSEDEEETVEEHTEEHTEENMAVNTTGILNLLADGKELNQMPVFLKEPVTYEVAVAVSWNKEITDTHNVTLNIADYTGVKDLKLTLKSLNQYMDHLHEYQYAVEKNADTAYLFYIDNERLFYDEVRLKDNYPFCEENVAFEIIETNEYVGKQAQVYKAFNTILIQYLEGEHWYIDVLDSEMVKLDQIEVPEAFKFEFLTYSMMAEELNYVLGGEFDGQLKIFALPCRYKNYDGYHITYSLMEEDRHKVYVNGENKEEKNNLVDRNVLHVAYFFEKNGYVLYSNNGRVALYLDELGLQTDRYRQCYSLGNQYLFVKEGNTIDTVMSMDGQFDKNHGLTHINMLNGLYGSVKLDSQGRFHYLDEESMDMVVLDKAYDETYRIPIPDEYLTEIKRDLKNAQHSWSPLEDGFVLLDQKSIIYYSFSKQDFFRISHGMEYGIRFKDSGVYLVQEQIQKFNERTMAFEIVFTDVFHESGVIYGGHNFILDGFAYYNDNPIFVSSIEEELKNNPCFKPMSAVPDLYYLEEKAMILRTKPFDDKELIQLEATGFIGIKDGNVFNALVPIKVREFDVNSNGILYTGYNDEQYAYYYDFATGITFTLNDQAPCESLTLMNENAYIVTQKDMITCYDIEATMASNTGVVPHSLNMTSVDPNLENRSIRLDDNNKELVVYNTTHSNAFTYVLDASLSNVIDGSKLQYETITDDAIILDALGYIISRDLKTFEDRIFYYDLSFNVELNYKGYLLNTRAYDGPGESYIVSINSEPVDMFDETLDYTIEIGRAYSEYLIVIDHVEKKVDVLGVYRNGVEYKRETDGLYYRGVGETEYQFYPIRENSKVNLYRAKRT